MGFDDKSEEARRERDEQRRKEWEMKTEQEKKAREQKQKKTYIFYAGVAAALVFAFTAGYFILGFLTQGTVTGAAVSSDSKQSIEQPVAGVKLGDAIHWHPELMISLCGKPHDLPPETGNMPGIHTHSDMPRIHLEATYQPSELTLGKAMNALKVKFGKGILLDKKDGDKCLNGKEGKVIVKSDGKEVADYTNLPLRDGQKITISFE